MKMKPGTYYGITHDGRMVPAGDVDRLPDKVICRRVADYPHAVPPGAAVTGPCADCGARIAWNPKGPHQDRPHVCMQCASIQPLPIEGES
ncbi:MAG TPA: hypothetical protein VKR23_16125 [Gaiellaceae bacterium]|nr:hypothetical protein [Gaiellaceae bacterium]